MLACPECARTQLSNPKIKDLFVDEYYNWEYYKHVFDMGGIKEYLICGNWGDPIYYKYLIEMCRYIKAKNPSTAITIHTNGSYQGDTFWKKLVKILNRFDNLVISIDGSFANSSKYRINQQVKDIIALTDIVSRASDPPYLVWKHIIFKYNIDSIDTAIDQAIFLRFDHILFTQGITLSAPENAVEWDITWLKNKIVKHFDYVNDVVDNFESFEGEFGVMEYEDTEYEKWVRLNLASFRRV